MIRAAWKGTALASGCADEPFAMCCGRISKDPVSFHEDVAHQSLAGLAPAGGRVRFSPCGLRTSASGWHDGYRSGDRRRSHPRGITIQAVGLSPIRAFTVDEKVEPVMQPN